MSSLTPIAQQVCEKRYFQKDKDGNIIEDWNQLVSRVVKHVCKDENDDFQKAIHDLIYETEFLPNSPCLVNAGKKTKSRGLQACFVSKSPEDCWSNPEGVGMIENIANFGHIARQGGGVGIDLSLIRPEGDSVFGSTHAKACGPIEHMKMLSEVMTSITQSGFRGMAMLACMRVDHPDILKFITCKRRDKALKSLLKEDIFDHYSELKDNHHEHLDIILDKFLSNFNISVSVTDEFMNKVKNDEKYDLIFNSKVYETIKARKVFDAIVENAWNNGDPGLLFCDAINKGTYQWSNQTITATNPCGEIPIPEFGSCNLGSIDVSKFYNESRQVIKWTHLKSAIEICMQFLDNVIDANVFPTPDFKKWAKDNRPVGLGIMGWADLLLKMKIIYGSEHSFELAQKMGQFFKKTAHKKSVELGRDRGTPRSCRYEELEYRRNVVTLSIAPTGTISLIAGCSSSIEPIFSATTYRYDNTGAKEMHHPYATKSWFKCASDLSWQEHIKMQATFQIHIDNSISKTINFPSSATKEDVKNAYITAWESSCKGITIYRDGSKSTQVLNTRSKSVVGTNHAKPRPKEVEADIFRTTADGLEWHVIVGKVDDVPYEVFAVNGKQDLPSVAKVVKRKKRHYSLIGEDDVVLIENLGDEEDEIHPRIGLETRRFSLELRHNIDPRHIVTIIDKSSDVITSFSKAVGRIMKKKYISATDLCEVDVPCLDCAKRGESIQMIPEAGCWKCPKCLGSKCS